MENIDERTVFRVTSLTIVLKIIPEEGHTHKCPKRWIRNNGVILFSTLINTTLEEIGQYLQDGQFNTYLLLAAFNKIDNVYCWNKKGVMTVCSARSHQKEWTLRARTNYSGFHPLHYLLRCTIQIQAALVLQMLLPHYTYARIAYFQHNFHLILFLNLYTKVLLSGFHTLNFHSILPQLLTSNSPPLESHTIWLIQSDVS